MRAEPSWSRARRDEAAVGAERPGELEVEPLVMGLLEVVALVHVERLSLTDEEGEAPPSGL